MIETKRTVTTLDGKQIELKEGGAEIWELELTCVCLDVDGSSSRTRSPICKAHVTREVLERCGKLPPVKTNLKSPPATPEDLLRALLESIGVVFE